jgi:hypothetical protein
LDDQRARQLENEAIEHLELLIVFVEQEFEDVICDGKNYLPEGLITYETCSPPPGCKVFCLYLTF